MTLNAASLSAILLFSAASVAAAGPIVDAAQRAEALQAEGKKVEALAALDEAVDAVWNAGPLAFRNVALVEPDAAAGSFVERKDRTFQPDEKLALRVEPIGYGYGTSATGAKIGFVGDFTLENATGQVLAETKDFFRISKDTVARQREFPLTLSFIVPYVRPGDYIARFTIRDQNSDKAGSFDVPFTIAAPVAAAPASDPSATPGSGSADAASDDPATAPAGGKATGEAAPQ